jgi:hypothetical protein
VQHLLQHVEALAWRHQHARVATVARVTRGAAEQQAEVHTGRSGDALRHGNGAKTEITGLGERADRAAAVEGEREFPRQRLQ